MSSLEYTKTLANLIEEFRKFPGVGPKSAQRMAFNLLKKSPDQVNQLTRIIRDAKENIKYCTNCFNLTADATCEICANNKRDPYIVCVVEDVKDLIAIERTREFHGHYHVLGGVISPLDGISPDDLNINALIERLRLLSKDRGLELILAVGLSTEGEATILYLRRLIDKYLTGSNIEITRLAYGLPVGADLDYVDESSLAKAINGRVKY